jgi:O-antigen/teichoic acid export membrane protein
MNEDSLRHKTTKALFWSFVEAVGLRGVQFIIGIVLARLLMPAQFGLTGMFVKSTRRSNTQQPEQIWNS